MASTRAQKVPQNRHPTVSARTTKLQNTVHTSKRRALTESLRIGGSFYSETFGIGCDDVCLWRAWTCVAARGFNAWDPPLVSVHLIGPRDRHLSKLQWMTLSPMTSQDVPPLLTLSGAVLDTMWDRVGHITLSDRCRRPVGREKRKNRHVSCLGHAS